MQGGHTVQTHEIQLQGRLAALQLRATEMNVCHSDFTAVGGAGRKGQERYLVKRIDSLILKSPDTYLTVYLLFIF